MKRMEPAHTLGGEEECHSSESGWTMYIGSPIDEDEEDNVDYCYEEGTQVDAEVESDDDSMASDASSGPSQYYGVNNVINPLGKTEGGYGLTQFKQKVEEEHDDEEEYCSDHKKGSKKKENQVVEKKGEKKIKGKDSVRGGGKVKVRKNQPVGTRK